MNEKRPGSADDIRAEVAAVVGQLEAASMEPSAAEEAVEALIDFGLDLADNGFLGVLEPIVSGIERLGKRRPLAARQRGWYLNLRAMQEHARGDVRHARRTMAAASRAAERSKDPDLLVNSHINAGIFAWADEGAEAGLPHFRAAIALTPEDALSLKAKIDVDLAGVYLDLGSVEDARSAIGRLSQMAGSSRRMKAVISGLNGLVAVEGGRLDEGLAHFRVAVTFARKAHAYQHVLTGLQNLASVSVDLGLEGQAIRALRKAERLALALGRDGQLDAIQRTLATALHRVGRRTDARRVLEAATDSARERGDQLAWARLTADLGALASLDGKGAEAISLLSSALSTFLAARDKEWGLLTARNAAVALVDGGQTLEAEAAIRGAAKALRLSREEAADLQEWSGRVLLDRGQPQRAARAFGRAVSLYGATKLPRRSDRLGEIAAAFLEASAAREAVRFFTQALSAHEPGLAEIARYQLLNDRALAMLALGRGRAADADLSTALEQAREQQDRAMQATLLANLSEVRRRLGDVTAALGYAREAVALVRETANETELADVLGTLGLAESAAIGPGAGELSFRTSLGLARKHALRAAEAVALGGLAQGAFAKGRYRKALTLYQQAAAIERDQRDRGHGTESLAAAVEAATHLRDLETFEGHLQRLLDSVQKDGGPVDVALAGIARSGGVWLGHGELETAAETFSAGILLAAVEGGDPGSAPFARLVGRAVVAPFVYAHEHGIAADAVEAALRKSLEARLAGSGGALFDLFPVARDATARATLGRGSRGASRHK